MIGSSLFFDDPRAPRHRHGTDALLLGVSAVTAIVATALAQPPSAVEHRFEQLLAALPGAIGDVLSLTLPLLAAWSCAVVALVLVNRRWSEARDLAVGIVAAVAGCGLAARAATTSWVPLGDLLDPGPHGPWAPPAGLAAAVVVTVVSAPHLVLPARFVGRALVAIATAGLLLSTDRAPSAVVAAVAVAGTAGALVHLTFGSSRGVPTETAIARALEQLGVDARLLGTTERQVAGSFVARAEATDGTSLLVKVRGRDAHDTELVRTAWRAVWYRERSARVALGRVRQAEHEALATTLAARAGVAVPEVVTLGHLGNGDAVIVFAGAPQELPTAPEPADTGLARAAWAVVDRLHAGRVGHGQLDDLGFATFGDVLGVVDLSGAEIAPSEFTRRSDEAQCFATLVLALGTEVAVTETIAALGPERVAALVPYLQPGVLTPRQRSRFGAGPADLDDARAALAAAAGQPAPELERLQRVRPRSLVQGALLLLAFFVLASAVAGLDLEALLHEVGDASWELIVVGFVLAQTPRFSQAASTLGAAPIALPYGPVYTLQLATSYLGLAAPSSAARVAVNVRFFQRQGLGSGAALAIGALDSVVGIAVQAVLVLVIAITASSLDLRFDATASADSIPLAALVVGFAVVATIVALASGRRRDRVRRWVAEFLHDARTTVRAGWTPVRVSLLLGGNLATELLFAATLACFVRAFGFEVPYVEILFINTGISLFASVVPVPGGIGLVEGGITFGLIAAGVPEEAAFAIAVIHRAATFYLPPIWGYVAFRRMERRGAL